MRAFKIAAITLAILSGAIIANSFYIQHICSEYAKRVDSLRLDTPERAVEEVEALFGEFKKTERIVSISVNHDDLTNIEDCFSEMIGAAKAGDLESAVTTKSRLKNSLLHLGRLSGINLDSII